MWLMRPIPVSFCDDVCDLGRGSVAVHMAPEHAFIFGAAGEHFLPKVVSFERPRLNALNVSLKRGFEGGCGQMADRCVPFHLPEVAGNLVRG